MALENVFPNAAQFDKMNESLQKMADNIGVAATLEITQVQTLEPGEDATISETPQSTPQNRQYILGIPKGSPGSPGPAYELTPEDKQTIVQDVLAALPVYNGEVQSVG